MEEGELYLRPEEYGDYDEMEEGQITAYPDELDHQRELQMLSEELFRGNCKEITLENILGVDIPIAIDEKKFVQNLLGHVDSDPPVKKLMRLYPEYNYGLINITIENNVIVNNMTSEYFEIIRKTKSQYMFIDVTIKTEYDDSYDEDLRLSYHANSVFVDLINLTAEYFEPQHHSETDIQVQLQVSRILRKFIHNNIRMTITSQSCPNLGPQSVTEDEFCQTWSTMFLYYKINLPEISIYEIYLYFSSMDKDQLNLYINKFIKCLVWLINNKEELLISATSTIVSTMLDIGFYIRHSRKITPERFNDIDIKKYKKVYHIILEKYKKISFIIKYVDNNSNKTIELFNLSKDLIESIIPSSNELNKLTIRLHEDILKEENEIREIAENSEYSDGSIDE